MSSTMCEYRLGNQETSNVGNCFTTRKTTRSIGPISFTEVQETSHENSGQIIHNNHIQVTLDLPHETIVFGGGRVRQMNLDPDMYQGNPLMEMQFGQFSPETTFIPHLPLLPIECNAENGDRENVMHNILRLLSSDNNVPRPVNLQEIDYNPGIAETAHEENVDQNERIIGELLESPNNNFNCVLESGSEGGSENESYSSIEKMTLRPRSPRIGMAESLFLNKQAGKENNLSVKQKKSTISILPPVSPIASCHSTSTITPKHTMNLRPRTPKGESPQTSPPNTGNKSRISQNKNKDHVLRRSPRLASKTLLEENKSEKTFQPKTPARNIKARRNIQHAMDKNQTIISDESERKNKYSGMLENRRKKTSPNTRAKNSEKTSLTRKKSTRAKRCEEAKTTRNEMKHVQCKLALGHSKSLCNMNLRPRSATGYTTKCPADCVMITLP